MNKDLYDNCQECPFTIWIQSVLFLLILIRQVGQSSLKAALVSSDIHLCDKSSKGTWFLSSRGLPTASGEKCLGSILDDPERMFPHNPKVPRDNTMWLQEDRTAMSRPAESCCVWL